MMNGRIVAPSEPKALTITLAEPADSGNISVSAGYVPASMAELEIPASKANTKAISYVGKMESQLKNAHYNRRDHD